MGNKAGFNESALIHISNIELDDRESPPVTPEDGCEKLYIKNGKVYAINSSGVEKNLEDTGTDTTEGFSFIWIMDIDAGANDAWFTRNGKATNSIPFVAGFDLDCVGITYSNDITDSDTDLEFYKNTVLDTTEELRDRDTFYRTQNTPIFSLDIGDRLSIKSKAVVDGTEPTNPRVELTMRVRNSTTGTGGT